MSDVDEATIREFLEGEAERGYVSARKALAALVRLGERARQAEAERDEALGVRGGQVSAVQKVIELRAALAGAEAERDRALFRIKMGPPSGRKGLSAQERGELRDIADARLSSPATERVGQLIYLALDAIESGDKAVVDSAEWQRLLFVARGWGETLEARLAAAETALRDLRAASEPAKVPGDG